jgi:hypothetical protein
MQVDPQYEDDSGVIPKCRVFISGARNLPDTDLSVRTDRHQDLQLTNHQPSLANCQGALPC